MSLSKIWTNAKSDSEAKFKLAYKAFKESQEEKIKEGDKRSRERALQETLSQSHLGDGPKYASYCSFTKNFSGHLDKLEASVKKYDAAIQKLKTLKVADAYKNKSHAGVLKNFCEKTSLVPELSTFMAEAAKLTPQDIYAKFVHPDGELPLNLSSDHRNPWDKMSEDNDWSDGKKRKLELFTFVLEELGPHLQNAQNHPVYRKYLAEGEGAPAPAVLKAQVDKVREVATEYAQQVQAYGKRWKSLKPDFWTPLNEALNEILGKVDEICERIGVK